MIHLRLQTCWTGDFGFQGESNGKCRVLAGRRGRGPGGCQRLLYAFDLQEFMTMQAR